MNILATLIAAGLAFSMTAPAAATSLANLTPVFAEPTGGEQTPSNDKYSIEIENPYAGHTYTAYQIFTGTLYEKKDGSGTVTHKILSNIQWSTNGLTDEGIAKIRELAGVPNTATPTEVAEKLEKLDDTTKRALAVTLSEKESNGSYKYLKNESGHVDTPSREEGSKTPELSQSVLISNLDPGYYIVVDQYETSAGVPDSISLNMLKVVSNTKDLFINYSSDISNISSI